MSVLAVIPARGGSKSIPQKNLIAVAGKPLIAYAIEAALHSTTINQVIVSTDDHDIARTSEAYGAHVLRRPPEISGDDARSEAALIHVLENMPQVTDTRPDIVVMLQCTSPLTLPEDIDGTLDALVRERADSSLAVADFHYFIWKKDHGNAVGVNHDKSKRLLRQRQSPQYLETGAVYAMRTDGLLKCGHRFFGKTAMYVMPRERCLEIDEPGDIAVAQAMLESRRKTLNMHSLPDRVEAMIFDFDGVFTDNKVLVAEDGTESVRCCRSDGLGLEKIKGIGIPMMVLSRESNPVVVKRCEKLQLECIHGIRDKLALLRKWLDARTVNIRNTVYVGNDLNDLECMRAVGCAVAVGDAHGSVRDVADMVLCASGGRGAVREICDLVIQKTGITTNV